MEQSLNLSQNVETLFSNIENFTHKEGVIGKPLTSGDKTFIPVVSVTIGCGGGNTAGKMQQDNTQANTQASQGTGTGNISGGALGLMAKVSTDAIIVLDKGNMPMMTLGAAGSVSPIIDKIPEMLNNMNQQQQNQ